MRKVEGKGKTKSRGKTKGKQLRGATSKGNTNGRTLHSLMGPLAGPSVRWFVVTGIVSVMGLALLQVPRLLQQFPITEVKMEEALQFVDQASLQSVMSFHTDLRNKGNYFSINLGALRNDIQALPWVESVDVRKIWPDQLHLAVEERVAIAIWQDYQLISHKGDLFKPEQMLATTTLPRLYGPKDRERYVMDNFHQMAKVLRRTQLSITELRLAKRLVWKLKLNNQIEVMIDKDQSVEKLLKFVDFYAQLMERRDTSVDKKIAKVDLRYSNGIAVTWDDV
ncbi:MAG: cell division protein FtsQ/DivIB [Pseudomonadales bacterium]|nr:cell division protein FtsQ/DivIB [Pseudomonadales bacterium]